MCVRSAFREDDGAISPPAHVIKSSLFNYVYQRPEYTLDTSSELFITLLGSDLSYTFVAHYVLAERSCQNASWLCSVTRLCDSSLGGVIPKVFFGE